MQDDGTCDCASGYYFSVDSCVEATATCNTGEYNDGADNCVTCGDGCLECTAYTGVCTVCDTDLELDSDEMGCGNCTYAIGPIDSPVTCVSSRYSATRIVPPFDASETAIDWRDWGVV